MKGVGGQASENVCVYDPEKRRLIDEILVERSKNWLSWKVAEKKPFFLYHPLVHLHFPTLPHQDFADKTKHGEFADSRAEMDYQVGHILNHIDELSIRENTIAIFDSDNGPGFRPPYRGAAGPWTGTYHTAMEGSLRVPFFLRWPVRKPAKTTSNEVVHITDLFTTLPSVAGASIPEDRPLDGIDQTSVFRNPMNAKSTRTGFLLYINDELRAIK